MSTPTVQFSGLSSGLDTKSIISALMQAEQAPLTRLQTAATSIRARKQAFIDLGSVLSDFLAKVQAFTLTNAGSARSATVADATKLSATTGSAAVPGAYRISVDRLATATRATSTAAVGGAIDATTWSGNLVDLPLPGSVTAGQIGVIVGGQIVKVAVGDPSSTSLQSVLGDIATAIGTKLGATVTASLVGNKVEFTAAGAGAGNGLDVRFGVGDDTSNFLGIVGLAGQSTSDFGGGVTAIDGRSLLGVVRTTSTLDQSGLSGLTSTTAGVLTINGVDIAYDTTTDSLNAILTRINDSDAGVIASVDRTNDRVVLTRTKAGASAINIVDTTGTLGAALKLAPGTTNAQVIGESSQVTVDGRTVVSDTNTVTNAVDGVTLNLLDQGTSPTTLTVSVDTDSIKKSLTDLVTSYNALADKVGELTKHVQGGADGVLANDPSVLGLALSLRGMLFSVSSTLATGSYRSLGDIGVNSGNVGSKVGSTDHLQIDATKLTNALTANPTAVARLLGSAGGIMQPLIDRVKSITGTNGLIDAVRKSADDALSRNSKDQDRAQERIDLRQAALEAKFATLEATLATLNSAQSSVASTAAQWGKSG